MLYLGGVIESALLERVNMGSTKEPDMQPKYSLTELLDPKFKLPPPEKPKKQSLAWGKGYEY